MRERIDIFKAEFSEFQNLAEEQIRALIYIYDQNIGRRGAALDPAISVAGGLLLWVGWLFFNSASGYEIVDLAPDILPVKIAVNTIVAAAVAGITYAAAASLSLQSSHAMKTLDPAGIMAAVLAGLVAVTGSCNNVSTPDAACIGFVGCLCYMTSAHLMRRWGIDDPIEAAQIHGFTGMWGVAAVGIFDADAGLLYSGSTA